MKLIHKDNHVRYEFKARGDMVAEKAYLPSGKVLDTIMPKDDAYVVVAKLFDEGFTLVLD